MKKSRILLLMCLLCITSFLLCSCKEAREQKEREQVTQFSLSAASSVELMQLDQYPNLTEADLRGSTCYDAVMDYIDTHPNVKVTYDVSLGGKVYPMDTASVTFEEGSYRFEELLDRLNYLKKLSSLDFPLTSLSLEQLNELASAFPQITLSYSVEVAGAEYPHTADTVNLSTVNPEQLQNVISQLKMLPNLNSMVLSGEDGCSTLAPVDVKILMEAFPQTDIHYTFQLFGQELSTKTETVEYYCVEIGNEGIPQVREALDIMPNCTYFKMDGCGIDDEVMAQLRDDYPNTKIVWRIWLVEPDYNSKLYLRCGSYLTDTHRVRTTYVNDKNSHLLNYCTETKYLDVGHVWQLTQCEFLAYMPDLEVCIIAITEITDITPLANHDKLEYLELFTTDISDLTPLLTCPNIEHLNLSNMPLLRDISPVYTLTKLQRLRMVDSPLIPAEQFKEAAERLPNCTMLNQGHFATAWFWRYYDGAKQHKVPRYELLCQQMEYTKDALEYGIP